MTYATVLVSFVVPAILASAFFARKAIDRSFGTVLAGLLVVVFLATFPWDAQAVRWGIWRFGEGKTCGVQLGVLPIEECAFFGLQTLLVAFLYRAFARR
jgi:lycopene cyclase domain-containing protein